MTGEQAPPRERVAAVVLAAGQSRRMGQPKPFLPFAGATFIEAILDRLREADLGQVIVIANPGHVARHEALPRPPDLVVANPRPGDGMLASLRLGIEHLDPRATHLLLTLGDMPAIRASTHAALADAALARPGRICVAEHRGKRGHPVVFPGEHFAGLAAWEGEGGARSYLRAHAAEVDRIAVDDPGIRVDADRPADLEALRQLEPGAPRSQR